MIKPKQIILFSMVVVGLSVLMLILVSTRFFQQTIFTLDDFRTEEDFTIPTPALIETELGTGEITEDEVWKVVRFRSGERPAGVQIRNNQLFFNTHSKSAIKGEATYKKNLYGKDIKIKGQLVNGDFLIYFNDINTARMTAVDNFLFEAYLDAEDQNKYHIFVNGEEVNTVDITGNKLNIQFISSGTTHISWIKSRPYLNCNIDSDEVIVSDRFIGETTFNLEDLTYINLTNIHFCYDGLPPVKRSLTQKGLRPIAGILTKLIKGESINVATNEVIDIRYIVDYREGMTERCELDEAYVPQLNKCEKYIFEEEDIDIFYNVHSSFFLMEQSVPFENSVEIFDKTLSISSPNYLCGDEQLKAPAGQPREECWKAALNYGQDINNIVYNEEVQINSYMKVKYIPSVFFNGEIYKDLKNQAILIIIDNNLLEIKETAQNFNMARLNEARELTFKVNNNLGNIAESGIKITKLKNIINTIEEKEEQQIGFKGGEHEYSFKADTSQIGEFIYILRFYYVIGGKTLYDDETLIISYKVEITPEEPPKKVIIVEPNNLPKDLIIPTPITTNETAIISDIEQNRWILPIISVLFIFILIVIIAYYSSKK